MTERFVQLKAFIERAAAAKKGDEPTREEFRAIATEAVAALDELLNHFGTMAHHLERIALHIERGAAS